jgi:hypothetical protein
LVLLVIARSRSDAAAAGTVGAIYAVLAAGYFWASRMIYRRTLARPLPASRPRRWLASLPGWLMVATNLACWLIPLELADIVLLVHPALGNWHGFLFSVGPIVVIGALGQAAGWLELQKRESGLALRQG